MLQDGAVCGVRYEKAGEQTLACSHLRSCARSQRRDTFACWTGSTFPCSQRRFRWACALSICNAPSATAQYGAFAENPALGAADYKLNVKLPDGTSAYTFCMCPGGYVVAAASEEGGVVTNGMSNCARDGENANAALLVTLTPEDFPDKSTLGGVLYQQQLERAAFEAGGKNYHAPAQLVGDFLAHRPSTAWKRSADVSPRRNALRTARGASRAHHKRSRTGASRA